MSDRLEEIRQHHQGGVKALYPHKPDCGVCWLLTEVDTDRTLLAESLALGGHDSECRSHLELCVDCSHVTHSEPCMVRYFIGERGEDAGECGCESTESKPLACTCKFGPLVAKAKAAGVECGG